MSTDETDHLPEEARLTDVEWSDLPWGTFLGDHAPPISSWIQLRTAFDQLLSTRAAEAAEAGRQEVFVTLGAVAHERDRLQRWKDEAIPVLIGLQDLGKALDLPIGTRITGPEAVKAVTAMREELQRTRDGGTSHPIGQELR